MKPTDALLARLRGAIHPLSAPPQTQAWNLAELDGLPLPAMPRPAAVLVGIIPRVDGAEVLLTRRTDRLRHHAGQVSFPGGSIEPGDLHPAAAGGNHRPEQHTAHRRRKLMRAPL